MVNVLLIGLGNVGTTLAELMDLCNQDGGNKGFGIYGYDIDPTVIKRLVETHPHIDTIDMMDSKYCGITYDYIIIGVPTPIKDGGVYYGCVEGAVASIVYILDNNKQEYPPVIILESTVGIGFTRSLIDKFAVYGLESCTNYHLAFSPERIDLGNKLSISEVPKLISGLNQCCLDGTYALYKHWFDNLVWASSLENAEATKLWENTHRLVNIAAVNEFARNMSKINNVDVYEVLRMAATKPYGYTPYTPGPVVGGECIPVDPVYLLNSPVGSDTSARKTINNYNLVFNALQVNKLQNTFVFNRILELLGNPPVKPNGFYDVLILGASYKANTACQQQVGIRELREALVKYSVITDLYDPIVRIGKAPDDYGKYDLVVLYTDHDAFDYEKILDQSQKILDCRGNLNGGGKDTPPNVVRLF